MPAAPDRLPRQDNRRETLRDAAARQFCLKGFHASSMRDIARAADMLPGSIYYHFPSKDVLLADVYEEGVRRISERVEAVIAAHAAPLDRLRAACVAHLEMLLEQSDYAQVIIRVLPRDVPEVAGELVALRDRYERIFHGLIEALPIADPAHRRHFRLFLLGALNWTQAWYRPGGESPEAIADGFLELLRPVLSPPPAPSS